MCNSPDSPLAIDSLRVDPNFRATHRPDYMTGWWGLWSEPEERWLHHSLTDARFLSTPVWMSREAAQNGLIYLPEFVRLHFAPAPLNPQGYFPAEEF